MCLNVIDKSRYHMFHQGRLWEIDVFHGRNEGLIVAEIELTSETESFNLPLWITQEVTGDPDYYNSNLSINPFKLWIKDIAWKPITCMSSMVTINSGYQQIQTKIALYMRIGYFPHVVNRWYSGLVMLNQRCCITWLRNVIRPLPWNSNIKVIRLSSKSRLLDNGHKRFVW